MNMTTMTTMTEWCAALDALRRIDFRLNAAAACPIREFVPGNGFIFATSFLYDALSVAEGESPLSSGREGMSAEALFEEARDWARYGLAYTPPGWENIASVFETLV